MASLLVVVFVVELAVHVINLIGATAINNLLWTAINFLPVPTSKAAAEQRKTQAEYLRVRGELNATSSQDEFARWAKIRRQHDKLLEKLETTKKSMEASRSKFDSYLTAVRLLLTRAPQYLIPFWYSKQPMFWLPHGWFPYYAEWIISFPRAPLGSVSIASWQLACTAVITLFSDVLRSVVGSVVSTGTQTNKEKVAMPAMPAKGAKTAKTGDEKVDEKKEL